MLTAAQRTLVMLVASESRRQHARELARLLGADDLLIFLEDAEVCALLPAPGFPQTLADGRRWQAFLQATVARGRHQERLAVARGAETVDVHGIATSERAVLALVGGAPDNAYVEEILPLLPLLVRSLTSEQVIVAAAGKAEAARNAAIQAHALTDKLSATQQALQRALSAAEAATRAKDDFLAVVSHELRTPLNAILGWTYLARMGTLDAAGHRRALETIERNAKAQARLIEDILDLSRIAAGRLRLNVQAAHLPSVIADALDIVRPAADNKGVTLQTVLDDTTHPISGDPDRLQQILWNLLNNAISHTPRGGHVQVRLARVDSSMAITVADDGEGIAPDFLPHIFERFRQADTSTTRAYGGLGLGLAIARELTELHGGTITVASPGKGQGAVFTVRLPLDAVQPPSPAHDRPRVNLARITESRGVDVSLDGARILIVEDIADAREMIAHVLRNHGAAVTAVASASAAMAEIAVAAPDAIVSDIEMPGADGYMLIRQLRALDAAHGGTIPAIALTAHAGLADRQRALQAGYQMHIAKPVEPAELTLALARLLKRSSH